MICTYENRPDHEPAVRLLLASLARVAPGVGVRIHHGFSADFEAWTRGLPNVEAVPANLGAGAKWNIKPLVLEQALADGHDQAVWIDADVIVARDFEALFAAVPDDRIILTEEALWGAPNDTGGLRARAWGFEVGRTLPYTANTAIIRVSKRHLPLLEAWKACLARSDYLDVQARPSQQRPKHMMSDQDVLTALLCSAEFKGVPVHFLERGSGILQLYGLKGFTVAERAAVLRQGLPPFIHAQGTKPWIAERRSLKGGGAKTKMQDVYSDTSPYLLEAAKYRSSLPGDSRWIDARTRAGRVLRRTGSGNAALTGLSLAALFDLTFGLAGWIRPRARRTARA